MLEKAFRSTVLGVVTSGIVIAGTLTVGVATAASSDTAEAGRAPTSIASQAAESPTVLEVEAAVVEYFRYMRENSKSRPASYSRMGSLEFWSNRSPTKPLRLWVWV